MLSNKYKKHGLEFQCVSVIEHFPGKSWQDLFNHSIISFIPFSWSYILIFNVPLTKQRQMKPYWHILLCRVQNIALKVFTKNFQLQQPKELDKGMWVALTRCQGRHKSQRLTRSLPELGKCSLLRLNLRIGTPFRNEGRLISPFSQVSGIQWCAILRYLAVLLKFLLEFHWKAQVICVLPCITWFFPYSLHVHHWWLVRLWDFNLLILRQCS